MQYARLLKEFDKLIERVNVKAHGAQNAEFTQNKCAF